MRVTAAKESRVTNRAPAAVVADPLINDVPFRLTLSAPAELVEIDTGEVIRPMVGGSPVAGTLRLERRNPRVALLVRWKFPAAPGEHRFAKLTLELPGQPTLTHVFDADGDIDDLLELPLPAEK